jgi:hypothetical protein
VIASAAGIAVLASWAATGLGLGLCVWSWVVEKNPIQQRRLRDCGVVLLFASILTRIVVSREPYGVFEWLMLLASPLFIAAALWRLGRTGRVA